MKKDRLLKLADLLENTSKRKKELRPIFDLEMWGHGDHSGHPKMDCKTTACAMGLAVVSGIFRNAGLSNGCGFKEGIVPKMRLSGAAGFDAAVELFDIDRQDAYYLFSDVGYPADKLRGVRAERFVAKRIRDFVKGDVDLDYWRRCA